MSAADFELMLWPLLALLAVALFWVVGALNHYTKKWKALPNKLVGESGLLDSDAAVIRWRAAHRLPDCSTCKWFLPMYYGGKGPQLIDGLCCRYPPTLTRRRRKVEGTDFCGEHTPGNAS